MPVNRERLNLTAHNLLRRVARARGLDLVRSDFNSPLVDTASLSDEVWERPRPMPGLELDLERQLELISGELRPLIEELDVPLLPRADRLELHLDNPWYGPMDAHLLYAVIRRLRPRRVLELGSGFSTLFIHRALEANRREQPQAQIRHEVVDPHPSPALGQLRDAVTLRAEPAAGLEAEAFSQLQDGDVLFVDTTHVVKPGGEVARLVLEVLPALAPGVVVHFHDIFIPFAYPRVFYDRYNVHWQEQYLVQAFLAFNPNFEVKLSNHALWRLRRDQVAPLFPGLREGMQPGAFWIVRSAET